MSERGLVAPGDCHCGNSEGPGVRPQGDVWFRPGSPLTATRHTGGGLGHANRSLSREGSSLSS